MDFISLYVRCKTNKNEIDYEKIKNKDFEVNLILDKLNEFLCVHIENQVNYGADVIRSLILGQD